MSTEIYDRVRKNTSKETNERISKKLEKSIYKYADRAPEEITKRIYSLSKEWDIDRLLQTNSSFFSIVGLLLGFFVNSYWLILSMFVMFFLFQHAIWGWSPTLPVFRWFGVRTQKEIDQEIYALKYLRGDFDKAISTISDADQALISVV